MKIRQKVGKGFKSLFDFRRWMGWDQIKTSAHELQGLAKFVLSSEKAKHKETFEEAALRLKLDEGMIEKQTSRYLLLAIIFLLIALALFFYSLYLLFNQHFQGFILGIFVSILTFSLCFREHFYYFQMKKRQLGCTFEDWLNFVLRRTKK